MTQRPLAGVRVVEISSFVAVPLAGMTLAQLGAEVMRVDPVGGAADLIWGGGSYEFGELKRPIEVEAAGADGATELRSTTVIEPIPRKRAGM